METELNLESGQVHSCRSTHTLQLLIITKAQISYQTQVMHAPIITFRQLRQYES